MRRAKVGVIMVSTVTVSTAIAVKPAGEGEAVLHDLSEYVTHMCMHIFVRMHFCATCAHARACACACGVCMWRVPAASKGKEKSSSAASRYLASTW